MNSDIIKIKTLVIPDRIHTRVQPEVYFAFESAAGDYSKKKKKVKFVYSLFNPHMAEFQYPNPFYHMQIEFNKLLDRELSKQIIDIRNSHKDEHLWFSLCEFMKANKDSKLNLIYSKLESILKEYSFIIIESTARTAIHPFYYDNSLTDINYEYAREYDLIDTMLGLFYIDIALKHNITMFATCHGAQLAYIHAGGKLKRLVNPYYFVPEKYYYPIKNPYDDTIEIWQFDEDLLNARNIRNGSEYTLIKTKLPKVFNRNVGCILENCINRDFNQTLAMVGPEPEALEVLLYHPLSLYKDTVKKYEVKVPIPDYPEVTEDKIEKFRNFLDSQVMVDTFIYGSIYAFQNHPHYNYNYGSNSEIFKFFIDELIGA